MERKEEEGGKKLSFQQYLVVTHLGVMHQKDRLKNSILDEATMYMSLSWNLNMNRSEAGDLDA